MGSSTKKHKSEKSSRESRKHKHRDEKSQAPPSERYRSSRRQHKRKSDRPDANNSSSNDESSTAPPPPKINKASSPPPPPSISSNAQSSSETLSIDETNKLRLKLGLKPLKSDDGDAKTQTKKTAEELMGGKDMGEFVHRAPVNLSTKQKAEKLRYKLEQRKDKRAIDEKLQKVKGLAADSSDDDASAWVSKSRKIAEEKAKAAKRAQMLEEMDAEFGVGELVTDEFRSSKSQSYSSRDLRGLRVEHDVDNFTEGRNVVMTLKDKGVLEEEDDVLVNVNLVDDEKYKKNIERKKQKPGYNAYDDEEVDSFGNLSKKGLLAKYDEEIDGQKSTSFVIGGEARELERRDREKKMIQAKLKKKMLHSLQMPDLQLASEYYTNEEMTQFKKPKKKLRKIRKKALKASDLLPSAPSSSSHVGRRTQEVEKRAQFKPLEEASTEVKEEPAEMDMDSDTEAVRIGVLDLDDDPYPLDILADVKVEPDEGELELQNALNKVRKLRQAKGVMPTSRIENLASQVGKIEQDDDQGAGGHIMLNATAEFCRTLGDIPTYGLAGNRDEDVDELMDYKETVSARPSDEDKEVRGTWNEVEVEDMPIDIVALEAPILEEEPDVSSGVAGALRLAVSKGYLEKDDSNRPSIANMNHLKAQNYSIEDKNYNEDDKHSRRERFNGPTTDFKEKDGYKPNIKLDYIDDDGRILNSKEAFRYLSHKFHGKGPGKNKVEKRMKKMEQEVLMKKMSSTDTPLGTVTMLQQKQKESHCPYVVLSGSKQLTSLSKTKM